LGDNLADVFNALRSRFDYVLLDTPPILLISDALILMQHVDASFLVTNTERSSKRSIQHLESILHQNDLTASFILNNIRMNRWQRVYSKYAYKYGYGYGYGHGYGYGYGGAAYGDSEE
jgi:Mrp family chromosome partitioning ATPase